MDYKFTTDGCSGLFMKAVHTYWKLTGRLDFAEKVTGLCAIHDTAYWAGGTRLERIEADLILIRGVAALKRPFLARMMFIGIGIGGSPYLPFPWRWGYGFKYPRGYDPS